MPINNTVVKTKLTEAIDNYLFGSTSTTDVLSLALSVNIVAEPNILTVNTIELLPNLEVYDSPNAIVCFINNLNIFAISSNKKWITLDGRLLRNDTGTSVNIAFSWGCNSYGQLGNNTTISRSSPVSVVSGFTDWCQVAAGGYRHSLSIRTNGTLWAWGRNDSGQLGDNTLSDRSSPVLVVGGFTDWSQVSAGFTHSLATKVGKGF